MEQLHTCMESTRIDIYYSSALQSSILCI